MQEGYTPAYLRLPEADRQVIHQALASLKALIFGQVFEGPQPVIDYLTLMYADLEHEIFGVLWLNHRHQMIAQDVLFRGTLTQTSVYPREVVKQGLSRNAGAAVLFHNHPSGCSEPSKADDALTRTLKQSLGLMDIRLLDHIVVSAGGATSFAERGLL